MASKELPIPNDEFTVEGHPAFLASPVDQPDGRRTPWVWYAPTLPAYPAPEDAQMLQRFLDTGIAVAGIDVGESFGNPEGRRLFTALHEELTTHRGLSRKACLLARSRGGTTPSAAR